MTTDNIIRCPDCGETSLVSTMIAATGARREGQPVPRGTDGLRCETCQRRYLLHGSLLTPIDNYEDDDEAL